MRSLFSGNRHSAPLGPPTTSTPADNGAHAPAAAGETLQAVRHRQRERQRHFVMQMMRAEKERDVAHEAGAEDRADAAETERRQMSDLADGLAQQIMIIERIMEEFGLTLDLEEEARADREMLEDSRDAYDRAALDAEDMLEQSVDRAQYVDEVSASYMGHEVYDEDEAMRDLDELAKQTGRA